MKNRSISERFREFRDSGSGMNFVYRAFVLWALIDVAVAFGTSPLSDPKPSVFHQQVIEHNQSSENSQKPGWFEKLFDDLKITDIFLATFTLALVLYTKRLWKSTGDLVRSGEQHSERELRAYLSAKPTVLIDFIQSRKPSVIVIVRNDGKTPAKKFRWIAGLERVADEEIITDRDLVQPRPEELVPNNVLHPRAEAQCYVSAEVSLTQYDIDEIASGKGNRLFVFGRILYEDIFGKERFTNFCAFVEPEIIKAVQSEQRAQEWKNLMDKVGKGPLAGVMIAPRKVEVDGLWSHTPLHNDAE